MKSDGEVHLVPGSRRGKPGRPREGDHGIFGSSQVGHTSGTVASKQQAGSGENGSAQVTLTVAPIAPRLLDLHATAAYLGLSQFTVRELEQQGILARVRVPLSNHGELRKLLFDRVELDRLVEGWTERHSEG